MLDIAFAPAPIKGHRPFNGQLWRWDAVEVDTGKVSFSIIFDDDDDRREVSRRLRALIRMINAAGAT